MISVLLTVLGVLLGLLVAAVALLVVVPTQVWAAGDVSFERVHGDARIRWGLGLVSFRVTTATGMTGELWIVGVRVARFDLRGDDEKKEKKKEKKKKKKKDEKESDGAGKWIVWLRTYRRTLMHVAGRLLMTLDPRLHVAGVVGLGDPADTALLFEILRQVEARSPDRIQLLLEREWLEEEVDVRFRFVALIWPLHLLLVAVALLLESPTRRMLRAAWA